MPNENLIYYGDTRHVPYGDKTVEQLFTYARHIIDYFLSLKVKAIIAACGSQSSNTLPVLEKECPVPLIGVLKPGVKEALHVSANDNIAVLATQATVSSGTYTKEIASVRVRGRVFETACPAFVPLVEAGNTDGEEAREAVEQVTQAIREQPFDTLILGCTHYTFLMPLIKNGLHSGVKIIDPAYATVNALKSILHGNGLLNQELENKAQCHDYIVSGDPGHFRQVGALLLPGTVDSVRKVVFD